MADLQVKTANICNITSSTLLNSNAGGSGTYISDNNISVYMSGTATWSGTYCQYTNDYAVVDDYYTISFTPICATNSTLQIEVAGTAKKITFTSGTRTSVTIQATSTSRYVAFYGGDTVEKTVIIKDIQIEKGETATVYRPYSATGWVHFLRKLTTATEAIENPLYSDGTAITAYTIKGNTVQNGTPTPSNPVEVNGVGVRTENLLDADMYYGTYKQADGIYQSTRANLYNVQIKPFTADDIGKTFTFVADISPITGNARLCANINGTIVSGSNTEKSVVTFTVETADDSIFFNYGSGSTTVTTLSDIMLVEGETAPTSYIPWGYKIPISSAQGTAVNYLGSVTSNRQIKKLVLTGTEDWIYQSDYNRFLITISDAAQFVVRQAPMLCTHYQVIDDGRPISDVPNNSVYFNNQYLCITTTDQSSKTDLNNYLAAQYAIGTPVTIWYVLATATTGIVNEPLMKIGTYADTLSNATAIPTTDGANSITVDTTVQPSEFTATWTGWHDAYVKEYDGTNWQ